MIKTVIIAAEADTPEALASYTAELTKKLLKEGITAVKADVDKEAELKAIFEGIGEDQKENPAQKVAQKVKAAGHVEEDKAQDVQHLKDVFNREVVSNLKGDPDLALRFKQVKREFGIKSNKEIGQNPEIIPQLLEKLGVRYA